MDFGRGISGSLEQGLAPVYQDTAPMEVGGKNVKNKTAYIVFDPKHLTQLYTGAADAFNAQEPRDEKGEWTDHGSFTLYHGSQYGGLKKFDQSKIGTGEGFQSYGHGFYLARNKGVAESYRDVGDSYPDNAGMIINGSLLSAHDMTDVQQRAYSNLKDYSDFDIDAVIKDLSERRDFADVVPVLKEWKKQGATIQKVARGRRSCPAARTANCRGLCHSGCCRDQRPP